MFNHQETLNYKKNRFILNIIISNYNNINHKSIFLPLNII
jgi:hypothetical protein